MPKRQKVGAAKLGTAVPGFDLEVGTRISLVVDDIGSLKGAAAIAGVTDETLANWRDGKTEPKFFGLARLAKASGRSLDWLATGEGPGAPVPVDEELLTETIDAIESWLAERGLVLPPDKKAALISIIYGEMIKAYASGRGGGIYTPP